MTRSRSSLIYILIVAIVCFAAGVASVLLRDDFSRPRPATASMTSADEPSPGSVSTSSPRQVSIVLLGVDDLSKEEPKLQAVWFASFEPPDKRIHLLGIPVDTLQKDGQNTLQQSFSLFEPPDFGANFLTSVATFAPYPIQGFIVLDEEGFAELIDYIGGVTLDSQELNGTAAIGALSLLKEQPIASLRMQARIIHSLTENAASIGSTPELTSLTSLVPEHAYTSPSPYQLASLGSQLLPVDPELVTIEIPPE
jgi:anionic cell wall polymer biosynthesis LytR-Cps2A-Psr (LCP) family protein